MLNAEHVTVRYVGKAVVLDLSLQVWQRLLLKVFQTAPSPQHLATGGLKTL